MRWAEAFLVIMVLASVGDLGISVRNQENTLKNVSAIFEGADEIRVDANGDGDLTDRGEEEDYVIYNMIYISAIYPRVELYPVYYIWDPEAIVQGIENYPGKFVTIRDETVLAVEADDQSLVVGRALRKKMYMLSDFEADSARIFFPERNLSLALDPSWYLKIVANGSLAGEIKTGSLQVGTEITSSLAEVTEGFRGYRVFLTGKGTNWVEVSAVETASLQRISDGDTEVFGYRKVRINSNLPSGPGRILFMGGPIYLDKENDTIRLDFPDYYRFNYDHYEKRLWGNLGVVPKNLTPEEEDTGPKEWRGIDLQERGAGMLNISEFHLATGYIKVDGNEDGDIDDGDLDHVLYNQVLVKDADQMYLGLVYTLEPEHALNPRITDLEGTFVTIGGVDYLVTYVFENAVKMGRPVTIRVYARGDFSIGGAVPVVDGVGFGLDDDHRLYVVKDAVVAGTADLLDVPAGTDVTSRLKEAAHALDDYRIFLTVTGPSYKEFALVARQDEMEIVDGQKNVFGYPMVRINSPDVPGGEGRIHFFGSEYNLTAFDVAGVVEAPYYQFEVNSLGELRIKLRTVPSVGSQGKGLDDLDEKTSPEYDGPPGDTTEDTRGNPGPEPVPGTNGSSNTADMPGVIEMESPSLKGICGPGSIVLLCLLPLLLSPRTRRGRWRS